MKHTLKAKYAADSLRAHRQRVLATRSDVLTHGAKAVARRRIVDAVTARLSEPARPAIDPDMIFAAFDRAVKRDALARFHGALVDKAMFIAMTATTKGTAQADMQREAVVAQVTARLDGPPKTDADIYGAMRYAWEIGAMRVRPEAVIKVSTC